MAPAGDTAGTAAADQVAAAEAAPVTDEVAAAGEVTDGVADAVTEGEADVVAEGAADAGALSGVTVNWAFARELSARKPAALIGTETQPPPDPFPHAEAGGFPAQCPTCCPDASVTFTVAVAGHCPVHVSSTCSDADVTCVPVTPTPDGPEKVSVPGPAAPVGDSRRV